MAFAGGLTIPLDGLAGIFRHAFSFGKGFSDVVLILLVAAAGVAEAAFRQLRWLHLAGEIIAHRFSFPMTLGSGRAQPQIGFSQVQRDALVAEIHLGEAKGGIGFALLSGLAEPFRGLRKILRDTRAIGIEN